MPKITYITHDKQSHTVEVQNGLTVMEGAVQNRSVQFKMIFQELMQIVEVEWLVLLAMFMSKKIG